MIIAIASRAAKWTSTGLKQHERHHDHDHDGCVLSAWLMAWGQPSEHSVTSFCPDPFCLAWWMDYHEHFQHLGISPAKSQQEELELHYEKVTGSTDSKACQRSLNDYWQMEMCFFDWSLPSCYRHVFDTRCGWLSAATEAHTHTSSEYWSFPTSSNIHITSGVLVGACFVQLLYL